MFKYVGHETGATLPGLPARDVSEAEIIAAGYTVAQVVAARAYGAPVYEAEPKTATPRAAKPAKESNGIN